MFEHLDYMLLFLSVIITASLAKKTIKMDIFFLPFLLFFGVFHIYQFVVPAFENSPNMMIPLFYSGLMILAASVVIFIEKYKSSVTQCLLSSKVSFLLLIALALAAYFAPEEIYRIRTIIAGICLGLYIRIVRQEFLTKKA